MQATNSELPRGIVVTPEDVDELRNLKRRVSAPHMGGKRRRGRRVVDWNTVLNPKEGEELPESLLDRIVDVDLSWLPGVLNEAVERGKRSGGRCKIDKDYVEKEIEKHVN